MDADKEIYEAIILDHHKFPRHYGKLADANYLKSGKNPNCGDLITLYLFIEGNCIKDVAYEAQGCAISRASASIMSSLIHEAPLSKVEEYKNVVHNMLHEGTLPKDLEKYGDLIALSGIREFPQRIKCVSLAWELLP